MGLEPAVLGLHEGEGEGIEHLGRAQPHEAAAALVDIGPKGIGIARAHLAVDAVRGDDQVGVVLARHRLVVLHEVLEHQLHAHVLAARLQDVEQLLAAYADEAMAAAAQAAALEVDRKSTRLNSSHQIISYAVFCLTKTTISCLSCT